MADLAGMQKAVDKINTETIPRLSAAVESLVDRIDTKIDADIAGLIDELHLLLDRINGATITATINIPPRK
jgi:hypothetical protein